MYGMDYGKIKEKKRLIIIPIRKLNKALWNVNTEYTDVFTLFTIY